MIPNIAHFVFFYSKRDFLFVQFIAIASARIVNNCDVIIHYYSMPEGKFTDILKNDSRIIWKHVPILSYKAGEKTLLSIEHVVDFYKINILYEMGGICLDLDTVCVKPWCHLLDNKFVSGIEYVDGITYGLCCAVFMTEVHGEFIKKWKERYEEIYHPLFWGACSVYLPGLIAKEYMMSENYTELNPMCTLLNTDFFLIPHWKECEKIWIDEYNIPDTPITLHLWHTNPITKKHMDEIVKDFTWIYENQHTLYSKIVQQLHIQ